jgi:hypothetical protein
MYVTTCSATRAGGVLSCVGPHTSLKTWGGGRPPMVAGGRQNTVEDERSNKILLPAAVAGVEAEDEQLLVGGEVAALHVRPEVVQPPEPAALARPL